MGIVGDMARVMQQFVTALPDCPEAPLKNVAFTIRFSYMAGGLSPLQKDISFVATHRDSRCGCA
jgi:hypothetical protein